MYEARRVPSPSNLRKIKELSLLVNKNTYRLKRKAMPVKMVLAFE
jgi:hypothetical protein